MSQALNTPEIVSEIFLNSDKSSIYNYLTVCKQWNDILNKEYFWKQYYKRNFPNNNSLDKLSTQMPNHTFKNLCKYKMANKNQLISNFNEKQNFPICNLGNLNNIEDDAMCIKQDCMVWFNKENLCLYYIEFNDPENIREFHVGSNIIMVDIIDNLIVCINVDYIIILFSRVKEHNQWHARLLNEPEHENGEFFVVNSCILDNLITISFFELIQQDEGEDENVEHQGDFKIIVWDLSLLIKALNDPNLDTAKLYDIKIVQILIPITFNPVIVHNCVYQKLNEKTGSLENNYYILSSTADSGIITVYMYDEYLKMKEVRNFMYDLEDDILLWASIHNDGTILAIGKKEIEIFNVKDTELSQHRKIPADIFDSFNLYDIILTPELLYIMMFVQGQEDDDVEDEVRLAIIDISKDTKNVPKIENKKENEKENEMQIDNNEVTINSTEGSTGQSIENSKNIKTHCTLWSNKEVCFNKFVDTGIVHYDTDHKQILFTPFSKCFCQI